VQFETKYFKSPDGRDFVVVHDGNADIFYGVWNEIYGIMTYYHEECAIREGDMVLDLGSNIGVFALWALEKYRAGLVVCVEAEPRNAECIKANLAQYGFGDRIVVVNKAVYSHNEGLKFKVVPNLHANHFVSEIWPNKVQAGYEIDIPSITIDSLVEELNLASVDFMKFDVEGSEVAALTGAAETIKRFKPRMAIAVYHKQEHPGQIHSLINSYRPDYTTEIVDKGAKVLFCW
jgi:FkbM family methyltransferase